MIDSQQCPKDDTSEEDLKQMRENIEKFLNSDFFRNIEKEIEDMSEDDRVQINKAVHVRDALITYHTILNIRRSKELTTFNMREFRAANVKKDSDGNVHHIVRISSHKTQKQGENFLY